MCQLCSKVFWGRGAGWLSSVGAWVALLSRRAKPMRRGAMASWVVGLRRRWLDGGWLVRSAQTRPSTNSGLGGRLVSKHSSCNVDPSTGSGRTGSVWCLLTLTHRCDLQSSKSAQAHQDNCAAQASISALPPSKCMPSSLPNAAPQNQPWRLKMGAIRVRPYCTLPSP